MDPSVNKKNHILSHPVDGSGSWHAKARTFYGVF